MQALAHDQRSTPSKLMPLAFLAVMTVATSFATTPDKAAGAEPDTGPNVVTLADSFGIGNGTQVYTEEECFSSPENFSHIYARQVGGTVVAEPSCGGATTLDLRRRLRKDSWIRRNGEDADVVFASMGGNDASFSTIVRKCYLFEFFDPSDDPFRNGCFDELAAAEALLDDQTIINSTRDTLTLARKAMPNAKIVVVGYPNLHVNDGDISKRIIDLLDRYTEQQKSLVAEMNKNGSGQWMFLDRRPLFAGHEVGSGNEWLWSLTHLKLDEVAVNETYHPKPIGWRVTAAALAGLPGLSDLSFAERAKGAIVKTATGAESWLVDQSGVRHALPDGGAYECAYASNGQKLLIGTSAQIQALPLGGPAAPECGTWADLINTISVDHADRAWWTYTLPGGGLYRREIPSAASFRCLEAQGHDVRRGVLDSDLNRFTPTNVKVWCLNPDEVNNKVLVDPVTNVSWLFQAHDTNPELTVRRKITTTETFTCLERAFGTAERGYTHEDIAKSFNVIQRPDAEECLAWQDYQGRILRDPTGRSVYVTGNGQRGVRDGGTFRCLTEWKNTPVNNLGVALVDSVPVDPAGWMNCTTGVDNGTIVRNVDTGWAGRKYTGADGTEFLAHIETSETYRCLTGKGVPVLDVSTAKVEAFLVGQTPEGECVNTTAFKGKIIRSGDGSTQHYIDPGTGERRAITTGGTSLCLALWANVPVHGEVFSNAQLDQFKAGPVATCSAHVDQARNKIVTASSGGHSIYVDSAGKAHNIQTANAYWCLRDRGIATMTVPNHTWQQAFSYGPDQAGCRRILKTDTGASYLELPDTRVLWLPDSQTYFCNADTIATHNIVSVSQATVDQMGVDGHAEKCLSPGRYEGKIVRDSNGRAGIVLSGVWRSVPDGHSWDCYRAKGYAIGENSISPTHLDSLPKGSRLSYCLNKANYTNVLVHETGGHWHKTNSSGCGYHVGNGWTYEALRYDRNVPVKATNLNSEHINSLGRCGTHPWMFSKQSFRQTLIRRASDGAVFYVSSGGCRYYVRDHYTLERRDEQGFQRKHWSAADSEINSLPYCGHNPLMLAKHRVENHVVRGPDGTSWFVRGGEWFWIDSGSKWNYLVNRYGLAPGTYSYTWEHIDSIKYDRGRWAGWW